MKLVRAWLIALVIGWQLLTVGAYSYAEDAAVSPAPQASAQGIAFFEQHIRPLLEQRCFKCHSSDAHVLEGGLHLDSRPGWQAGGDSGEVIVPGKPDESLLVRALWYSDDESTQMPPDGKLPEREIELLTEWVKMGAPDPRSEATKHSKSREIDFDKESKHWAYQPLTSPAPPPVNDAAWCRNPIDQFILAKLEARGIAPNVPAKRRTLIRRVYFDCLGLPPTPEEVTAFVEDTDPAAYEKLVDRVLASPHFGERWGRHWLDLARFAESHGFEQDYNRDHAYHYRDFVIKAFNQDLPYDTFVKWQLAGDEFDWENPLALQATGFLAAGVHATQITANQAEKERYDELDDMTRTVGTTFLGLTVGCARCHDHKYDPLTMKEYYGLATAFTTTVRSDYEVPLDSEDYRQQLAKYEAEKQPLEQALADYESNELPLRLADWLAATSAAQRLAVWTVLDPVEYRSLGGTTLAKQADASLLATGTNPDFDEYTIVVHSPLERISALRIEALADASLVKNGPGRATNGNFDLTNVRLTAKPRVGPEEPRQIKFVRAAATFDQSPTLSAALVIDDQKHTGWAVDPQFGKDHAIVLEAAEDFGFAGGTVLEVVLEFYGNNHHNFGKTRLSATSAARPVPVSLDAQRPEVAAALTDLQTKPLAGLADAQRTALLDWYKPQDSQWKKLHDALQAHMATAPKPQVQKMLICSEGVPAVRLHTQGPDFYDKTFVVKRGDPNQKVEEAQLGFLRVLTRHPDGDRHWLAQPRAGSRVSLRRTALANWLTDVEYGAGHLLARVIVNRLWQYHMGRGIVATPSDFGTQGAPPTHPELLDWLANELIAGGWRLKPLHKMMLTSSVYMQTAELDDARVAADRENDLWWRRPGGRLQAEIIRDAMLASSGLLDTTMFGKGTLDPNMRRRSIYFFIKRSQLIPMMLLFDAPDSLQDMAVRSRTTVAPQALLLMNNPQVRQYAEGLAQRATTDSPNDLTATLRRAYQIALSRLPTNDELTAAQTFVAEQTSAYTARNVEHSASVALTDFCQTLYCLNEFVYVD